MQPHEVLGVSATASEDEIRKAFREAAMRWHPDRNPGPEASARFQEAVAAYEALRGRRPVPGPRGAPANPGRRKRRRGEDVEVFVGIDEALAASGGMRTVRYERLGPCGACGGLGGGTGAHCPGCRGSGLQTLVRLGLESTIRCEVCGGDGVLPADPCSRCDDAGTVEEAVARRVQVPSACEDGGRVRHNGEGNRGLVGGRDGDLRVVFRVGRQDLQLDIAAEAGSAIHVDAETGRFRVKVPTAATTGTRLRLRGKGWEGGDLYLKLTLVGA
ncbi:MAG TPA: DnaJ domain-containing protein [Myxococcota bacterium]|nr:DnaJ domain-containing protein [Myxococcota bacterium]